MVASHCTVHELKRLLCNRISEQVPSLILRIINYNFRTPTASEEGGGGSFYKIYMDLGGRMTTGNK